MELTWTRSNLEVALTLLGTLPWPGWDSEGPGVASEDSGGEGDVRREPKDFPSELRHDAGGTPRSDRQCEGVVAECEGTTRFASENLPGLLGARRGRTPRRYCEQQGCEGTGRVPGPRRSHARGYWHRHAQLLATPLAEGSPRIYRLWYPCRGQVQ